MNRPKINIHLYQSPFQHESRILRITKTLADERYFDKIFIMATYLKGLKEIEVIDEIRTVYRIKTIISPKLNSVLRYFFLIEWGIRIFFRFRKMNIIIINPHSVPTLPIAYLFKKFLKTKIVYDTHEIETEQYLKISIKKKFSKFLEKTYIKNIDYLVATSDGYAKWYIETYKLNSVAVVKNYSRERIIESSDDCKILREYFHLKDDDILFIYQGIIAYGRGIEMLLDIFASITLNKHIVFMGFGPLEDIVKDYCKKYSNIHFHPAVKPENVYKYVQSCDVGFCIIENIYLSYYYTLPNKMLECLNVGVPVIVSNFPDMSSSVNEYNCGWTTEPDINSIKNTIYNLTPDEIKEKSRNALLWAKINTWESQEKILRKVYEKLLSKN